MYYSPFLLRGKDMEELQTLNATESEAFLRFQEAVTKIKESFEKRRKQRTPKRMKKERRVRGGKTVNFVSRAGYQVWLDENLPAYSIKSVKFWVDKLSKDDGGEIPMLFNCSCELSWVENGIVVTRSGVGSVGVSAEELAKDNTTYLDQKYNVALTMAIKSAAGWSGAFFDLRYDEEAEERASMPPTKEQNSQFEELLKQVPESAVPLLREQWAKKNIDTADEYLEKLKSKIRGE